MTYKRKTREVRSDPFESPDQFHRRVRDAVAMMEAETPPYAKIDVRTEFNNHDLTVSARVEACWVEHPPPTEPGESVEPRRADLASKLLLLENA